MPPNAILTAQINDTDNIGIEEGERTNTVDRQKCKNDHNSLSKKEEEHGEDGPTNEYLLNVAFISFFGFCILQGSVAFVAQSQAMIGDTAAMGVDALTYLFNMFAEKKKNKPLEDDGITPLSVCKHEQKVLRLKLEIIPPLVSVVCLVYVTYSVLSDSISTLLDPVEADAEDQPNIQLMFYFSALNLAIDMLNVGCFARAKKALGYLVIRKDIERYGDDKECRSECIQPFFSSHKDGIVDVKNSASYSSLAENEYETQSDFDEHIDDEENVKTEEINLNMCSAYTHVFADTLRSITVFIGAGIASMYGFSPEKTDAISAIIVSFIILISLGPLLGGLVKSCAELRALLRKASEAKDREAEILLVV